MISSLRQRANAVKCGRCKNLIAVLEEPSDPKNIGAVIRNINALGVEKLYIVDPNDISPILTQEENAREVTLITCTNGNKERLVVRAREINNEL